MWGRSWEGGGAPEYWPWIEVLRALDLGDAVAELETAASSIDDAGARFRVFDRIATAVRGATSTPTIVVLDDLHVADEPTVRLTQFVARSVRDAPLLLLGAHRDEQTDTLVELGRDAEIVRLGALTVEEVREMLDVPPALADRIAEVSGGNPFFADELARLWTTDADTRVPSGVREVVRHRVSALPSETIELLSIAAVVGRSFDIEIVARVGDIAAHVALDRLAAAARADLVRSGGGRTWQFAHDLVRASIADDLEPSVAGRRHHAVADVLETIPTTPPAVIAHHCWEAGPLMDGVAPHTGARFRGDATPGVAPEDDALAYYCTLPLAPWAEAVRRG